MFKRITSLLILLGFVIAPALASPLMLYGIGASSSVSTAGRTPAQIGNCIFWGSADDLSAVGNGNAITTWVDKGGSGNDLTATSGDFIYRSTLGPDSKPAIDSSSAVSGQLAFSSEKTNLRTVVTVIKIDNYGDGANPPSLGVGHSSVYHWHSNAANTNYTDNGNTSASVYNGAWRHDGGSTFVPSNTEFTTTYKIVSAVTTGNTSVDCFGADRDGAGFFRGYVSEWALFSTALTNTELDDLHAYFGAKYNITVTMVS